MRFSERGNYAPAELTIDIEGAPHVKNQITRRFFLCALRPPVETGGTGSSLWLLDLNYLQPRFPVSSSSY